METTTAAAATTTTTTTILQDSRNEESESAPTLSPRYSAHVDLITDIVSYI